MEVTIKTVNKIFKSITIIFTILIMLIISLFIISPVIDDIYAKKVADKLENIPLPEKSQYIQSISQAGKFTGNGNGIQFLGLILIESELNADELNKYYSNNKDDLYECYVKEQVTNKIGDLNGNLSFNFEFEKDKNYFIVYSFGKDKPIISEFDLRSH